MKLFNHQHKIHKESFWRFALLAFIVGLYFLYMSWHLGTTVGAWISALTWSFFVLCTPVADGGFLIAFPVRILFGTRMLITQIIVWGGAILINIIALTFSPESYQNTAITKILFSILTTPWPYWSILFISASGTALSIWFGDEMLDVTHHKDRVKHHNHGFWYRNILILGFVVLTIVAYYSLLHDLHIVVPS